jgi:hypothetical protein
VKTENGNLKELLLPYPADQMRMWEISPRVNTPKNDDPSLWELVHAEPGQTTDALGLFREYAGFFREGPALSFSYANDFPDCVSPMVAQSAKAAVRFGRLDI